MYCYTCEPVACFWFENIFLGPNQLSTTADHSLDLLAKCCTFMLVWPSKWGFCAIISVVSPHGTANWTLKTFYVANALCFLIRNIFISLCSKICRLLLRSFPPPNKRPVSRPPIVLKCVLLVSVILASSCLCCPLPPPCCALLFARTNPNLRSKKYFFRTTVKPQAHSFTSSPGL